MALWVLTYNFRGASDWQPSNQAAVRFMAKRSGTLGVVYLALERPKRSNAPGRSKRPRSLDPRGSYAA